MKSLFLLFLVSNFSLVFASPKSPDVSFLPVDQIMSIEKGFDSNDSIEIAVQGHLPNTCHRISKGSAQIDEVNKKIIVFIEGYVRTPDVCAEMIIPFVEVIQIGFLKPGMYTVYSALNSEISGKLEIAPTDDENRDDYLYAPVDTVELIANENLEKGAQQVLHLKGTYPFLLKGCMRVTEIKTYSTENNVLVVQPIAELFEDKDCNPNDVDEYNRFSLSKEVETNITEKGLVHVRTLNGRALNKYVDFTTKP